MGELLTVDNSRCGSLPPQVGGKLTGYLVMRVDEILWCRKALDNIIVLVQWWGETEVATFRPANVKSLTNGFHEESPYFYKVMTSVKLFECYLANCETLELIVLNEGSKTPIGSVTLQNLHLIIQENPYQSYFPLINSFGNRIADVHVCFNLKLNPCASWESDSSQQLISGDTSSETKMGLYRPSKIDMKHSKSNEGKKYKHCKIRQCSKHPSPTSSQSRTILSSMRESISEQMLLTREVVPDHAIAQILTRGQRLRNAMVKSVLEDGIELTTLKNDSTDPVLTSITTNKTAEVQHCSTKPEAKLLEYLLGKDLNSKEEELALNALHRMSPVASFVEIAQQVFSDETNNKDSVNVESHAVPPESISKSVMASKGTATSLDVCTLSSYGSDDNLWEHVQKQRPSLQAEVSSACTSRKHNKKPQTKLSDKTDLLSYARFLHISVQRVSLNFAGLQRVLVCAGAPSRPGNNPSAPPGVVYFVEYEVPHPLTALTSVMKDTRIRPWTTKLQRFCSKKQIGRVVHFDARSVHPLACTKPAFLEILEYSSLLFRVYSRYLNQRLPALVGEADLPLASLLDTTSSSHTHELSIMPRLGASRCRAPLGMLRVKVELSSDRTHLGSHTPRPSDGDSTEEESGTSAKEVSSSSEPSGQTNDQAKEGEHRAGSVTRGRPIGQEGRKEKPKSGTSAEPVESEAKKVILLHGLLHVSEGRGFSSAGSYLVCRSFWREDAMSSDVCWHADRPYYGFHELMPVLLTPDLLNRSHNNFLITELWDQYNLLGLAKLPLNQFYVAYRDPLVAEQLLLNKYPVVSVDGWVNVINPSNRQLVGQLNVVLALGTEEQIQLLETTRGLRDALFSPTPPDPPPPSLARDPPTPVPPLWQASAMHKSGQESQNYCGPSYNVVVPSVGSGCPSLRAMKTSSNVSSLHNQFKSTEDHLRASNMIYPQPNSIQRQSCRPQSVDSIMRAQGYLQRINKHTTDLDNRNATSGLMEPIPEMEPLDLSLSNGEVQLIADPPQQTQIEDRRLPRERMVYSDHSSTSSSELTAARARFNDENFGSSSRRFKQISRNHLGGYQHCTGLESCSSQAQVTSHKRIGQLTKGECREQSTKSQDQARGKEYIPGRSEQEIKLKEKFRETNDFLDLIHELNTGRDEFHIPGKSFTKQTEVAQESVTNMSEIYKMQTGTRQESVQIDDGLTTHMLTHGRSLTEPLRMDGGVAFHPEDKQDTSVSLPESNSHSSVSGVYLENATVFQSSENKDNSRSQSINKQDGSCAHVETVKPFNSVSAIDDVRKDFAVASVTTQTERRLRDSFRARVEVVSALHLPLVRQGRQHREPSCYVTFQTDQESGSKFMATQVVLRDVSPTWEWACETKLSAQLLQIDTKRLIFKVWHHVDGTAGPPDTIRDAVLGFAAVDLSVLLFGLPWVAGWFNVTDFTGRCRGQIKINVAPLENIQQFANHGTASSHLSRQQPQLKTNIMASLPNSSSFSSFNNQYPDRTLAKDTMKNTNVAQSIQHHNWQDGLQPLHLDKSASSLHVQQQVLPKPSNGRGISVNVHPSIEVLNSSKDERGGFGAVHPSDNLSEMIKDAKQECHHQQITSRISPVSSQLLTTVKYSRRSDSGTIGKMHQSCEAGVSLRVAGVSSQASDHTKGSQQQNTLNQSTANKDPDIAVFDEEFADVSSSFLSRALKQKLSELDEITHRLKRRLSSVTNEDVIPPSYNPWLEEAPQSFSPQDACCLHEIPVIPSMLSAVGGHSSVSHVGRYEDIEPKQMELENFVRDRHLDTLCAKSKFQQEVVPEVMLPVNNTRPGHNADMSRKDDGAQEESSSNKLQREMTSLHIDPNQEESVEDFDALTDYLMHLAAKEIELENVFNPLLFQHLVSSYGDSERIHQRKVGVPLHSNTEYQMEEEQLISRSDRYHPGDNDHIVTSKTDHVLSINNRSRNDEVGSHSKAVREKSADRLIHGTSRNEGRRVLKSNEIGYSPKDSSVIFSGRYHNRDDQMMVCVQSNDNSLDNRDQHNFSDFVALRKADKGTLLCSDEVRHNLRENVMPSQVSKDHFVDDNVSRINIGITLQSHETQHHPKDNVVQQDNSVKVLSEFEHCSRDGHLIRRQDGDKDLNINLRSDNVESPKNERESDNSGRPGVKESVHNELNEGYFQSALEKDNSLPSSFISLNRNYDLVRSTPSGISTEGNELEVLEEIASKRGGNSVCPEHIFVQNGRITRGVESIEDISGHSKEASVKSSSSELDFTVSSESTSSSSVLDVRRQAPDGGNPPEECVTSSQKPMEKIDKTSQNSEQGSCVFNSTTKPQEQQQQH